MSTNKQKKKKSDTNNVSFTKQHKPLENNKDAFSKRHIGPTNKEMQEMLDTLNYSTVDEFIHKTTPAEILNCDQLNLPSALSEAECLKKLKKYAQQNKIFKNYIGRGYYETELPTVIQRNILENPIWLTSYTPYQSEISQGRLQALLNFQTMITEITEMDMANASLLDEGTATAEAISMAFNNRKTEEAKHIFIDENVFPQTKAILQTRANSLGLKTIIGKAKNFDWDHCHPHIDKNKNLEDSHLQGTKSPQSNFSVEKNDNKPHQNKKVFCTVIQYPDSPGAVYDWESFCSKAKENKIITIFVAEPLSLCLLKPPGTMGADIVTGSCQRLGIPLFFGGPHAAYIATKKDYVRSLPGRIVGVSKDRHGKQALRLVLQTREQHIRRERATSNICTAQALLAVISSMYALYHGPEGLKKIASRIHFLTLHLIQILKNKKIIPDEYILKNETNIFDTVQIKLPNAKTQAIYETLIQHKINAALLKENGTTTLSFSINETTTVKDIEEIVSVLEIGLNNTTTHKKNTSQEKNLNKYVLNTLSLYKETKQKAESKKLQYHTPLQSQGLIRTTPCLKHPVFQSYHSETKMLRYIHKLQEGDLSLAHSMIPLGSCTMKLNSTTELTPVSWPGFSHIHPFAPFSQTQGYQKLIRELEQYLCEITGFSSVSFQPNAGSQGEYAGLLIIRKWHEENKNPQRKICLIPSSAHGTNPASAVMAGLKPVTVHCNKEGNISREDLKRKIDIHGNELAAFMLTFPSTFGVFEKQIPKICEWIHAAGGLVYLDGANMNALIGISQPAKWGADVCHLNLHKTFCIPHGGGGPGVGPVAVTKKLAQFLPSHPIVPECGPAKGISAISSAPWGSAGILMISWAYIRLMGPGGLKKATQTAILNANYISQKLSKHYKILYTGDNNRVAHECILDLRKFRNTAEITVDDVAKRLIDYGFHAP
ncbi:MAG: aminomethyl-transferring glycine dehydrogenase, partial [Bdellovibrionales bacterium]|nr:aminomethyl-transferring glycine dehydrogenase [Bdellovibrionales bacterium]